MLKYYDDYFILYYLKETEDIRVKSAAAEALIEELMEENEELKRDIRLMVEEMDELQDNFRFILFITFYS